MAKFKVGDRARVLPSPSHEDEYQKYNNQEVLIVKYLGTEEYDTSIFTGKADTYYVKAKDGEIFFCHEDFLEPITDLGSWDELQKTTGWRPGNTVSDKVKGLINER